MISTFDDGAQLDFMEGLEEMDTLLMFDVVNKRSFNYSPDLDREIERDGVVLYEKI